MGFHGTDGVRFMVGSGLILVFLLGPCHQSMPHDSCEGFEPKHACMLEVKQFWDHLKHAIHGTILVPENVRSRGQQKALL